MEISAAVSESQNDSKATVDGLYKALANGDAGRVASYVGSDLEWWFHGPQNCHHMMKVLTGKTSHINAFRFNPRSIDVIDDYVIVEGWEGVQAYWVHVWTLKDGLITQFREYFNTWLTVADLRPLPCSTSTLWQSHPRDLAKRSLPGLMLAI